MAANFLCSMMTLCQQNMFIIALVIIITTLITYYNRIYRFWTNQGIMGPKPVPVFGNLLDNMFQNPLIRETSNIARYGKIYGSYEARTPVITIADPKLIKKIMIKDFNIFPERGGFQNNHKVTKLFLSSAQSKEWQRLRSTISPTFTSSKMKHMFSLMDSCVDNLKAYLNNKSKDQNRDKGTKDQNQDKEIDAKYVFGNYTMDVIAKCCFATDLDSAAGDATSVSFVNYAKVFFKFPIWRLLIVALAPKFLIRLFKFEVSPGSTIKFFTNVSKELILRRRAEMRKGIKMDSKDFLQLMLESGSADQKADKEDNNQQFMNCNMSDDEIIANSIQFLTAGYETTANLLTYCSYVLATYPDIQDKLYEEIKMIRKDLNYDKISNLEYLDAFIQETLRIYPPAAMTARVASTDYYLMTDDEDKIAGDKKTIFIPKGAKVAIPIYAIQHMDEYFDEAEKFNPDRFLSENRSKINPYTLLAFGAGPRNCVGMRFALLEAKIALAKIILDFKFFPTNKTDIPLDFSPTLFLLAAKRVIVGVEKRK